MFLEGTYPFQLFDVDSFGLKTNNSLQRNLELGSQI